MILKLKTLAAIKKHTRLKNRLALELDKSGYTVERWISDNEPNSPLTTAKALQVIREELGVTDSEILEEEVATVNK